MPYIAEKPKLSRSIEELRKTIPGWGVDLDRADRPAVPKERFDPGSTGAHWDFPERQMERWPRERSIEHAMLTPVFGTSCPPRGLSGLIRRYAYRRFSEGRIAHWMLLVLADRVDVAESRVLALAQGRPDNIIAETGVRTEIVRHGIRSRVGQHRADLVHQPLSLLGVALPALCAVGAVYLLSRRGTNGGRSSHGPTPWRASDREQDYGSSRVRGPGGSEQPWRRGDGRGYHDGAGIGTAE